MKYKVKSILFLGVGGISMHQLAIAFKKMGIKVFGYDANISEHTIKCEENGVLITNTFDEEFCKVDLCVKTGAIQNNQYFNYLNNLNIPIIDRADVLNWLCSKFKNVIAVAGTHGKSTTSTLIYEILKSAGKKVSCHIGADVKDARFEIGDDYLVVEACEYNKSFLRLTPTISVVTNIEKEHMDCYSSLFDLRSSFLSFLKRADKRFVFLDKSTKFLTKYSNIDFIKETELCINPQIKGEHNLKNISVAAKVCESLGVPDEVIKQTINSFKGVARRYEYLGQYKKSEIFIDYAHHPTEIKAFVETFQKEEKGNFQIIFQPHTYSRTKYFFKEFVSVLSGIKNLIIFKEYSARENAAKGISAKVLYSKIKEINPKVRYCEDLDSVISELKNKTKIAFVGAGDINKVAEELIKK